jgi:hypothetical protein
LGSAFKKNQKGTSGSVKILESNQEKVVKEKKYRKNFRSFYCTANIRKTVNFRE